MNIHRRKMWSWTFNVALLIAALVAALLLTPAPSSAQGKPTDMVLQIIAKNATLQDQPGSAGQTVRTLGIGQRMKWGGIIRAVDGRNWLQVSTDDGTFWTSPDNEVLVPVDPTLVTYRMDRSAVFQSHTSTLTLYQSPSMDSAAVATIPTLTQLTVADGPTFAELYTWWQVETTDGKTGWMPDVIFTGVEVIKPLRVYGYDVCDNFNLKEFGATGWDSIVDVIGSLIPAGEQIVCIGSTNLKGDNSPIVVILSRIENVMEPHDTLRAFENFDGDWRSIFETETGSYAKTDRLSLHDFTGDNVPSLLWGVRADGTGGILDLNVLRYVPEASLQSVLRAEAYKGQVQVGENSLIVLEAHYKENEPNCCPSGLHRMGYEWQNSKFVKTVDDIFQTPYFLQAASVLPQ